MIYNKIVWSIKDIVNILKLRQTNKFDGNIVVSGDRGNGKSTLISKIFYRMGNFKPWKHQVYNRDDVISLLKSQQYGLCFDDEAVNSGYKRDFQDKVQQELIKIVTAYRDNYNIYASAIPNFFSLDKDLRDLTFLLLFVVRRGMAIVHMPLQGRMYLRDKWDSDNNRKKEMKYTNKVLKDPNFRFPHHKLSTYKGILYFGDLPTAQHKLYEEIKKTKRTESFDNGDGAGKEESFYDKVLRLILEGKMTKDGLQKICLFNDRKYSIAVSYLNQRLKDLGNGKTLMQYLLLQNNNSINTNQKDRINQTIPA